MSDNELSIPSVEVVENGKPVSQERMDPAVISFIMQAASVAQLVKLRKLEESKIPTGVKPLRYTVTDTIKVLRLSIPWISFSLINDGANAITVWINDEADPQIDGMIGASETYTCNMDYPVIRALYLKSESGTSNAVRIYGKEGRRT